MFPENQKYIRVIMVQVELGEQSAYDIDQNEVKQHYWGISAY